jgi:hypothetical protein
VRCPADYVPCSKAAQGPAAADTVPLAHGCFRCSPTARTSGQQARGGRCRARRDRSPVQSQREFRGARARARECAGSLRSTTVARAPAHRTSSAALARAGRVRSRSRRSFPARSRLHRTGPRARRLQARASVGSRNLAAPRNFPSRHSGQGAFAPNYLVTKTQPSFTHGSHTSGADGKGRQRSTDEQADTWSESLGLGAGAAPSRDAVPERTPVEAAPRPQSPEGLTARSLGVVESGQDRRQQRYARSPDILTRGSRPSGRRCHEH